LLTCSLAFLLISLFFNPFTLEAIEKITVLNVSEKSLKPMTMETSGKIYVKPEEIKITENGIFYVKNEVILPIYSIHFDAEGFYIEYLDMDGIWDTCQNGHKIYHQYCGGCAIWGCPFICKCFS